MIAPAGITRYRCPLPGCGWTAEVLPTDAPMVTVAEQAMRWHADSHSALEYVRALTAAQEQTGTTTSAWRVEAGYGDQWRHAGGPFTNRATAVDHLDWCRSLAGPSVTHRLVRDDTTHTSTVEEA